VLVVCPVWTLAKVDGVFKALAISRVVQKSIRSMVLPLIRGRVIFRCVLADDSFPIFRALSPAINHQCAQSNAPDIGQQVERRHFPAGDIGLAQFD
jgi:hypothetical protein